LFISSVNDGAVKWGGGIRIPDEYTILEESQLFDTITAENSIGGGRSSVITPTMMNMKTMTGTTKIPDRSALVFDREDAPNHISFLAENVNDAMISFLAPLLPIAQAFEIPVLDFDKYVTSRDSAKTAEKLKPLILNFLLGNEDGIVAPTV
jgi:hypothetical protein